MKFNIGDKVLTHHYLCAGQTGVVVDRMNSEAKKCAMYTVKLDESNRNITMQEDLIEPRKAKNQYSAEVQFDDTIVIVRICQTKNGKKTEVAKGHGHIIHDGIYGFGQAVSYAAKRAFMDLEDLDK